MTSTPTIPPKLSQKRAHIAQGYLFWRAGDGAAGVDMIALLGPLLRFVLYVVFVASLPHTAGDVADMKSH